MKTFKDIKLKEVKNLTITTHEQELFKKVFGFWIVATKETKLFVQADLIVEGDVGKYDILQDRNGVDFLCTGNNEITIIEQLVDSFELLDEFIVVGSAYTKHLPQNK